MLFGGILARRPVSRLLLNVSQLVQEILDALELASDRRVGDAELIGNFRIRKPLEPHRNDRKIIGFQSGADGLQ